MPDHEHTIHFTCISSFTHDTMRWVLIFSFLIQGAFRFSALPQLPSLLGVMAVNASRVFPSPQLPLTQRKPLFLGGYSPIMSDSQRGSLQPTNTGVQRPASCLKLGATLHLNSFSRAPMESDGMYTLAETTSLPWSILYTSFPFF